MRRSCSGCSCRNHQNKSSCKRRKGNRCNSYVPAFIYKDNLTVNIDGVDIPYTISFGGSFFALVDTTKLDIGEINAKTVPAYTELGMKIRDKVNAEVKIQHPTLDITEVDLVEFYGPTPNPDQATMRNVVVFGDAQADRSPCGTGTSANSLLFTDGANSESAKNLFMKVSWEHASKV